MARKLGGQPLNDTLPLAARNLVVQYENPWVAVADHSRKERRDPINRGRLRSRL
jgi:hypothetical protein